ncbi:MAG: LysM peptidoglycan-binding domain-containing protein, partial [Cyanobacteria bacterium J083]
MENKTPKIESMVDLTKDFVSEESANSYIAKQKTNLNSPLFGLALSLGSSCLIIAGQEQQATAAVYFPLQTQASLSQTKQPVANNKIIKHRVGKGDTLKKIAKKYKLPVDKIAKYNKISKQGNLAVGKTILIPQQVKVAKKSNKISQTQTKNNLPDKSKFEIASLNLPHQDKQKARHIPRFISSSQAEKISLEIN